MGAIQQKPNGILPMLDEECALGRGVDDGTFLAKLHNANANGRQAHPNYIKPRFSDSCHFGIRHFAGQVHYNKKWGGDHKSSK